MLIPLLFFRILNHHIMKAQFIEIFPKVIAFPFQNIPMLVRSYFQYVMVSSKYLYLISIFSENSKIFFLFGMFPSLISIFISPATNVSLLLLLSLLVQFCNVISQCSNVGKAFRARTKTIISVFIANTFIILYFVYTPIIHPYPE